MSALTYANLGEKICNNCANCDTSTKLGTKVDNKSKIKQIDWEEWEEIIYKAMPQLLDNGVTLNFQVHKKISSQKQNFYQPLHSALEHFTDCKSTP